MDVVSIRESRNHKNSSSGPKLATSAVDLKRSCRKKCFLGLLIPKGGEQRSVFGVFLVRCPNWWKGGETGEEANYAAWRALRLRDKSGRNKQTWRTTVCKYTVCSVQYFVKSLASLKQLSLFRDNLVSCMWWFLQLYDRLGIQCPNLTDNSNC